MVPVDALLIAVIALCPAESELARAFAVVAEVALPVNAPVKVVAPTETRPDIFPPVIKMLLAD